jgi:hypothetical protein
MAKKKFFWKIWLRPNKLTKDVDNDYVAEVSTNGKTALNRDVAEEYVKGRSDHDVETVLSIINGCDLIKRNFLLDGRSVQDSNMRYAPRVTGAWIGTTAVHDPDKHSTIIEATMTAELRGIVEGEVGVEILGVKADGGAQIGLVTDVTTNKTDGTVTSGGQIVIIGEKIELDPPDEPGIGIFLRSDAGEIPVTAPPAVNHPSEIITQLPELSPGVYTLYIVTRFTGGKHVLKAPRTITYATPLTVL